jgi:hypothetical protein
MGMIKTCTVRGVDILLDVDSEDESGDIRNYETWRLGHYEQKGPDTLDWIDTHFKPGDTVFDIGANIGQYSLYAAKLLNHDVRILAFEPQNRQGTMSCSLDDLTTTFGLPAPNHIKVDVDGIEDLIVDGAVGLFGQQELRTFLIEVYMHGDIAQRVRAGFEAGGFALSNEAETDFTEGVVQNLIFAG